MINPYDGTIGMYADTDHLKMELNNFLTNHSEDLSYELVDNNNVRFLCITGSDEDEQRLPNFQHPFVFTTPRGIKYIAGDFRLFVKSNIEKYKFDNIADVVKDMYNYKLLSLRMVLTKLLIESDLKEIKSYDYNLAEAMSRYLSSIISLATYDRSSNDAIELATTLHYYNLDDNTSTVEEAFQHLPAKLVTKYLNNDKYLYRRLIERHNELVIPSRTIGDLLNNIQVISANPRLEKMTLDILISLLTRTFYSNNSKENSVVMFEHKPTFIAIFYMVMTEGINSKSMMRKIIDSNKAIIKHKDVVKRIEEIYNDNIILVR